MENSLQKKMTLTSLIKYTLPTIVMMVLFSCYTIIDGMFISKFIGSNALSATNIVFPVISLILGVGIMFATGGSAIVAKKMGEGKNKEAKEDFTLITISALVVGCIIAVISITFMKEIIYALGSTEALYDNCEEYLFYMVIFTPFVVLKLYFDYFLVTAGVPNLGLISGIVGGLINIVLDYVFIVELNLGVKGAALATCIGYIVPSFVGIIYFMNKKHALHFIKPKFNFKVIKDSCTNGSSEMVTQLASAITTFIFNIVMIKYLGEDGVAAITIILYLQMLLNAAYIGFTSGVQPRISYNYGSENEEQLEKLIKYSILIISVFGVSTFIMCRAMADVLVSLFSDRGTELFSITRNGLMLFSTSFLVGGINIFSSGMFTAFSNGKVSALLSLLRTFIFFALGMMFLPKFMGVNGVWLVIPFAEVITLLISIAFIYKYRKEYMYENLFARKKAIDINS